MSFVDDDAPFSFRTSFSSKDKTPRIDHICLGTTENMIFSCLSPTDLIRFSLTCQKAYEAVLAYNRIAYNIKKLLLRYFTDDQIEPFRLLQDKTGALISGSAALQFFDRTFYEESDFDLFVSAPNAKELAYFIRNCGYSYVPRGGQHPDLDKAIATATDGNRDFMDQDDYIDSLGGGMTGVWSFVRNKKKIQIISARHSPLAVVLTFHSTCVMQIISARHAVSLYPFATIIQRRSLILTTRRSKQSAIQKYEHRGWEMVQEPTYSEVGNTFRMSDFRGCMRHVGDRLCWTIPLPPLSSDNMSSTSVPPLFANSWTLELWPEECKIRFNLVWRVRVADSVYETVIAPRLTSLVEEAQRQILQNAEHDIDEKKFVKVLLRLYEGRVPDLMRYRFRP